MRRRPWSGARPSAPSATTAAVARRDSERPPLRIALALASAVSAGASFAAGAVAQEAGAEPRVSLDSEGLTVRSRNGRLELNLSGFVQLDAGGGEGRGATLGEPSLWRSGVPRAWGEAVLKYDRVSNFALQVDAAARRQVIRDLGVGYLGLRPFTLAFGNLKEPFSFEQMQQPIDLTFMERALPVLALAPDRSVGPAMGANGERWTAALGVYGGNINDEVGGNGIAVTSRATYAPVLDDRDGRLLHFGLSGSQRWINRDAGFGIGPNPESFVYNSPLIGFDPLRDVRRLARGGVEVAFQQAPYHLQAEYIAARAERGGFGAAGRGRDATFHGGYVQLAAVLKGQPRSYSLKPSTGYDVAYAVFGGVETAEEDRLSQGGMGGWEVAARYSFLDLDTAGLGGGRQHNVTVGLNWRPEQNLRLMLNYARAFGDDLGGENAGRRARAVVDIVQLRLQIAYW